MAMPDYDSIYQDFFAPLAESEAEFVAFPGFGFWPREYAQLLANITAGAPEILLNHGELCKIIAFLFEQQYGANQTDLCPPLWDNLSCFPAIEAGQLSVIPCPQFILNTPYDTSSKPKIVAQFLLTTFRKVTKWKGFVYGRSIVARERVDKLNLIEKDRIQVKTIT